jgi:hypothetical protein
MKKNFILSMLISFGMICSCQKQDSTAEHQLAQRKVELDAHEKALEERMNALEERLTALNEKVKALAEEEKAIANARPTPTDAQGEIPDPAQVQAERERTIEQFSAEMRAMVPDDAKMKAEKDRKRQSGPEKLQSQRQRKLDMVGGAVFPAPEATSPTPSPAVEATSPSPAAEATLPNSSPTPE